MQPLTPATDSPADAPAARRSLTRQLATAATAATLLAVAGFAADGAGAATRDGGAQEIATPTHTVDDDVTCRGEPAVLVTSGTWNGTAERDVVVATGVSTTIWASGGDDLICVVNADYHGTTVNGGPGDDVIISYGGANDLYGQGGSDVIIANGFDEHVEGGDDDDFLKSTGASFLYGNDGDDRLTGGADDDHLDGGAGNDVLYGFAGEDDLIGGTGADELVGGADWDDLDGSPDMDLDVCQDSASAADGADLSNCDVVSLTPAAGFGGYAS